MKTIHGIIKSISKKVDLINENFNQDAKDQFKEVNETISNNKFLKKLFLETQELKEIKFNKDNTAINYLNSKINNINEQFDKKTIINSLSSLDKFDLYENDEYEESFLNIILENEKDSKIFHENFDKLVTLLTQKTTKNLKEINTNRAESIIKTLNEDEKKIIEKFSSFNQAQASGYFYVNRDELVNLIEQKLKKEDMDRESRDLLNETEEKLRSMIFTPENGIKLFLDIIKIKNNISI